MLPSSRSSASVTRRAALAAPAAAIIAGAVAPSSGAGLVAMLAAGAGMAVVAGAIHKVSGRVSHAQATATLPPITSVTVLLPARNEAAVIGALIGDLGRAVQAGRTRQPVEILVVDDGSTDGTSAAAETALTAAALLDVGRVVRLDPASGSKGRALRRAWPDPAEGQLLVVLDADARVKPDFLIRCVDAAATEGVVQAQRHVLGPGGGGMDAVIARVQDGEFAIDDVIQRVRWGSGGASELRGNGMVLRGEALAAIGGWPHDAQTEDLELSTCWYLASGVGVARPSGLELWEQPVLRPADLIRQRLRWAEGSVRRDLRHVRPVLADGSVPLRQRADIAMYAGQALVPWLVFGMLARAVLAGPGKVRRRAMLALGGLVAAYAAGGLGLARSVLGPGVARHRVFEVAAFTSLWSALLPIAWIRVILHPETPEFFRTQHLDSGRFGSGDADKGPDGAP